MRGLVAVLILLAGTASAEVRVRTAEHGSFTRIVIDYPKRPDWTLSTDGTSWTLQTRDADLTYDLSDAFRRIDKARVSDLIDMGDGNLRMQLACRCRITTTELPNQGLILDVALGLADPPEAAWRWTDIPPRARSATPVLPGRLAAAVAEDPFLPERADRLDGLRRELASGIARSAAEGLVQPAKLTPKIVAERSPTRTESAPLDTPHSSVSTGMDRATPALDPVNANATCLPPQTFDISAWAPPGWPDRWVGGTDVTMTDAADRADAVATVTRARHLLYLGFGAEAGIVLQTVVDPNPTIQILIEIAAVVDTPSEARGLDDQGTCSGAAFWRLLSTRTVAPSNAETSAVIASFSALPQHLRTYLGPRFVTAFLNVDAPEAASNVRTATLRGNRPARTDIAMMDARIALHDQQPEKADSPLITVATSRDPTAAEAMQLLFETRLAKDTAIETDLVDKALALAYETGGQTGQTLRILSTRALGRKGDIARGFRLLADLGPDAATLTTVAIADLNEALNSTPDDGVFLRLSAMAEGQAWPMPEDPAIRIARAQRLVDLGVIAVAQKVLSGASGIPDRETRLLQSRIQIELGDADLAESYLAGLSGPDIAPLRDRIARDARLVNADMVPPPDPNARESGAARGSPDVLTRGRDAVLRSRDARAEIEALLASP